MSRDVGFEVFTAVVLKLIGLHGVISQKMILFMSKDIRNIQLK
jgi:hypothetical protein